MRFLITGVNGLLGSNLAYAMNRRGHEVIGTGRQVSNHALGEAYQSGDLLQPGFAHQLLDQFKPDVVINCVGLANVDLCENDPTLARTINGVTAANLADAALKRSTRFLHISTDHLFKGERAFTRESDTPEPINEYGRSKLEGEKEVLTRHPDAVVVRTNFYGWSPSGHASTFAEWLYKSLLEKKPIQLYTDYFFNSIEVSFLAEALEEVALSRFHGLLNIAASERNSKYEFGQAMADAFGLSTENARPSTLEGQSMRVQRPRDLSLSTDLFKSRFKTHLPTLKEGMSRLKSTSAVFKESTR